MGSLSVSRTKLAGVLVFLMGDSGERRNGIGGEFLPDIGDRGIEAGDGRIRQTESGEYYLTAAPRGKLVLFGLPNR